MKWVYLATAPDQISAEMWKELLHQEGMRASIRAGDTVSFLGVSPYPCRIMVPEGEKQKAKDILEAHLERPVE